MNSEFMNESSAVHTTSFLDLIDVLHRKKNTTFPKKEYNIYIVDSTHHILSE